MEIFFFFFLPKRDKNDESSFLISNTPNRSSIQNCDSKRNSVDDWVLVGSSKLHPSSSCWLFMAKAHVFSIEMCVPIQMRNFSLFFALSVAFCWIFCSLVRFVAWQSQFELVKHAMSVEHSFKCVWSTIVWKITHNTVIKKNKKKKKPTKTDKTRETKEEKSKENLKKNAIIFRLELD